MATPLWRLNLQPASFKGVPFHVDVDAKSSGLRMVPFEFPKSENNYAESMGRRIRKYRMAAYIVFGPNMPDYQSARDALIAALEDDNPGQLVHPTMGVDTVYCDNYSVTERRERGGIAEFEIEFLEAGSASALTPTADTNGAVTTAAQSAITQFQQAPEITST